MKNKVKIIIILIFVLIAIPLIDLMIINVFNSRPIFVIKGDTYKDGGSQIYYGIGYKVIKCNTLSGDKSIKIGFYNLEYSCDNSKPLENKQPLIDNFEIIDESEECNNEEEVFYVDNNYVYSFNCQKSDTVFIKFNDDKKINLQEAVMQGLITMSEIESKIDINSNIGIQKYPHFIIEIEKSDECKSVRKGFTEISSTQKPLIYDLYYNCINKSSITIANEKYDLIDALKSDKITINKIIANLEFASVFAEVNKTTYNDGKAILYNTFNFSILKCTIKNNTGDDLENYIVGDENLKFNEQFCQLPKTP